MQSPCALTDSSPEMWPNEDLMQNHLSGRELVLRAIIRN